jgi:CheY-like chemotaxis protein
MMARASDAAGLPLEGRSVLVVEDEFLLAEELCRLVEALGGRVVGPAASAEAALRLLDGGQPDLALLDVNLGGQRVYPVAEALRSEEVPFAFTTGYDRVMIDPRFRDQPHLEKPFSASALRSLVERLGPAH